MSIELYPSVAKIKRNGVFENLPGFVPEIGSIATQQMIAPAESSNVAQYVHNKGEYFRLNDTLYQAIVKINIGDSIVVGTNCEVAVIGNDITHIANSIADYELGIATATHTTGEYFMVGETLYVATDDIQIGDNISTSTNCQVAIVGDKLSELQKAVNHGINLFDKFSAYSNTRIKTDGTAETKSNYTASDFINVEPSTTYYVSRGLGSTTYLSVAEYGSDKSFVNGVKKGNTSAFSFTTTENTYYIRLNVSSSYVDTFIVSIGNVEGYSGYKLVGSGNVRKLNLVSNSPIFYDNSSLYSKSDILLITNDNVLNFGTSISVGNGNYLFYNLSTGALTASDTFDTSKDVYFVEALKRFEYYKVNSFKNLTKSNCPIEYDAIGKSVTITVDSSTYLFYDGKYYTFNASQSTTLTSTTNHFIVYFSFADEAFHLTSTYSSIKNDCIIIMEAFSGLYQSIAEVKTFNTRNENSYVRYYTFGDSLTWYNGHEFNRGVHEGEVCVGYQSYLNYYCNMRLMNNEGASGKTTPQICAIFEAFTFPEDIDAYAFIMGGDNDDRLEVSLGTLQPIGGTFDTTTVYGALQHAIETVQATYPLLRIILMTEPQGWTYDTDHLVQVNPLIAEAYRKVAETYALPLIDLWNESGINALNRDTYYADPPAATNTDYMYHPNNDGWKRISKLICNRVMGL